jgi:hypothetical protein
LTSLSSSASSIWCCASLIWCCTTPPAVWKCEVSGEVVQRAKQFDAIYVDHHSFSIVQQ